MDNWIWILVGLAFLWLIFRRGGCCGHAGHVQGAQGGASGEQVQAGDPVGETPHNHPPSSERQAGLRGAREGGCH